MTLRSDNTTKKIVGEHSRVDDLAHYVKTGAFSRAPSSPEMLMLQKYLADKYSLALEKGSPAQSLIRDIALAKLEEQRNLLGYIQTCLAMEPRG